MSMTDDTNDTLAIEDEPSVDVTEVPTDDEPAAAADEPSGSLGLEADPAEADPAEAGADVAGADADGGGSVEGVLDEDEFLEAAAPKPESPYDRPGKWFVLHTQSGYENKVKQNLEARSKSMNMEHNILEISVPLEDVVEVRNGKKVTVQKKMFPGYLLLRCHLNDDS